MSLCQITGSYGPYRCKARTEDKFQKSIVHLPTPKKTFMSQRLFEPFRLFADPRFPSLMMTLYVCA